jgi:GNAT superfamily N-acetyltransferase
MARFAVKLLTTETWPGFEALAEAHNGVFGGCWCLGFHAEGKPGTLSYDARRQAKYDRVRGGTAHAALVYAGEACVGWCQFGSPDELPRIKNRKTYDAGLAALPAWRITCFFVDRHHRKQGVASAALQGALQEINRLGGGIVEAYPEDTAGKLVSPTFLHAGTLALFEAAGFARERQIGKNTWVVRKALPSD